MRVSGLAKTAAVAAGSWTIAAFLLVGCGSPADSEPDAAARAEDTGSRIDSGTRDTGLLPCSAATCPGGQVCCAAPAACAGQCVPDCRIAGNACPQQVPVCEQASGVCKPGRPSDAGTVSADAAGEDPTDAGSPPLSDGGVDCREMGNACSGSTPTCDLSTGACTNGPSPYPSNELLYSFYAGYDAPSLAASDLDRLFQIAAEDFDLKYLKVGFRWNAIEPQLNTYDWTSSDAIAALAQRYGLSIIAFFPQTGTPVWAQKDPAITVTCPRGVNRITSSAAYYADFIGAFVDRYATSMALEYLELENEPNSQCLWPDTGTWLASVDNAVYAKVKAGHPSVKVCSASIHQPLGLGGGGVAAEDSYTDTFLAEYLGALGAIDCFSLHDYGYTGLTQTNVYKYATQYDLETNLRAMLDAHGKTGVPIVHTECGYPRTVYGGDELGAAYLPQSYLLAHAKGSVGGRMCQAISPGVVGHNGGEDYGVADIAGGNVTYRAGYFAFKTLRTVMARFPAHQRHVKGTADDPGYFAEHFVGADGADLFVLFVPVLKSGNSYPAPATQSATVHIGAGHSATVTASDGTQTTQAADAAGDLALSVGALPVYVEVR